MDIVHHAFIGGAGFLVAATHDQPLIGAAFVAGSVFPDLDVFFMVLGKRFYLRNHQGITHSLLLSPLFAALLCIPLWLLPGDKPGLLLWLAAWCGLVAHVMLDWFNTYRIELFGPFSSKRFSLDAVFFIDSVALLFTALFYLSYMVFELRVAEI
ncbi:MAG: metal-dependent hydrolase, partial [Gammaproteobacteria bacterium]|nr:metal-dependent hydrolase [Gammaproteobacteria bacterium]